ncbi:MAG: hypothetical protein ACWA5U_10480 [bacterium]
MIKMTRHMWLAVFIAPLLGFGAYYVTGLFSDAPTPTEQGDKPMIPLVFTEKCLLSMEKTCAATSDDKRLKADFQIREEANDLVFLFTANRPLENTMLQINKQQKPYLLDNRGAGQWQIKLDKRYQAELNVLYFVAQHEKALYYVELNY